MANEPTPDETAGQLPEDVRENQAPATTRTAGTSGTGIAAGETGYAETGQLPDTAARPVVQE